LEATITCGGQIDKPCVNLCAAVRAVGSLDGIFTMVKQRIRVYRDAGITTLHILPQGEMLAQRLATLGRFMDLVRSVNAEESATPAPR
jgi:hypothetical protein